MVPLKLVTFDVTGTILLFTTPVIEKYLSIGLNHGIKAESRIIKENFQKTWKNLNSEIPNFGSGTSLGWKKWWTIFVERTFDQYLEPQDKIKAEKIAEELLAFHTTKQAFTIREGTIDLLEYLHLRGITLGIISNYDCRLHTILDIMGLKKYFNFVLVSYDFGVAKPSSKIFEEALKLGNCSSGREAIHIGDNLQLDYFAAQQVDMGAILISENIQDLKNTCVDKNKIFQDFPSLLQYFKKVI